MLQNPSQAIWTRLPCLRTQLSEQTFGKAEPRGMILTTSVTEKIPLQPSIFDALILVYNIILKNTSMNFGLFKTFNFQDQNQSHLH